MTVDTESVRSMLGTVEDPERIVPQVSRNPAMRVNGKMRE